jgi:hypothetical protein
MKKKFKQNRVKYVVGDNFGQPVMVEHVVPADEPVEDASPAVPATIALADRNGGSSNPKHRAKRTCGQSQRSARIAKKQREKK